jgi:tetratricopeptide (TPR) repeat protein
LYTELLNKVITKKNDEVPMILKAARGIGYIGQGKYREAIKDFEDAIKENPQESFINNLVYAKLK